MFLLRFVVFDLQESSKYLVAKGRDQDAINVLEHIARRNGKKITLTLEQLQALGGDKNATALTTLQVLKLSFSSLSMYEKYPSTSIRLLTLQSQVPCQAFVPNKTTCR